MNILQRLDEIGAGYLFCIFGGLILVLFIIGAKG